MVNVPQMTACTGSGLRARIVATARLAICSMGWRERGDCGVREGGGPGAVNRYDGEVFGDAQAEAGAGADDADGLDVGGDDDGGRGLSSCE